MNISDLSHPRISIKLISNNLNAVINFFCPAIFLPLIFTVIFFLFLGGSDAYADSKASSAPKKLNSVNWFWMFYEHTENLNGITSVYRPFYMEAAKEDKLFQASLMPLFFWRYKDNNTDVTKGFFGLYESTDYKHSEKNNDYDNGFFPLFLYGNGEMPDEQYMFIYPFGGTIRGKFAYERISPYVFPGIALFFLFPPAGIFTTQTLLYGLAALIPVYTEFEDRGYNGTALFWPFIAWGKSDKREDFRFLPFYAHNSKAGWYDNYQYLLLFNYRELYFKDDTRYTFFFFPFYGKKWSNSGNFKSYTVLWPFFSWGYDKETNERTYNLPWPLVQISDCDKPKIKKRIFFPFWGKYESPSYESMFVTPLYFRIKNEKDNFKSEYHITCIIAWWLKRDYAYKHEYYGNSWRYFKLWPLVQVEWSDSGLYGINVLSLLPFRDTEGYEKLYQPFWTLFEYRVKPDGEKHLGFLLRTYYQVWNDDMFKMKIPIVVSYESRGEQVKEFTILLSSFGYKKNEDGAYLKLFWFPLKIGDGDAALADSRKDSGDDMDLSYNIEEPGFNQWHSDLVDHSMENKFYYKMDIKL